MTNPRRPESTERSDPATAPHRDKRSLAVQAEDDLALVQAELTGFVIRRTMQHNAHRLHIKRCRDRGLPCICVYVRREVADVTLKMPTGRMGWQLGPEAQRAATELIRRIGCAAYNVGPRRVVSCRMTVDDATELAELLVRLAGESRPAGEHESATASA